MIVVKIFKRDKTETKVKFENVEEMNKYIAENLFDIDGFKILNDGRLAIEFKTTDKKRITKFTNSTDILEGILDCIEQAELEQERIKNIHIIRPYTDKEDDDEK